MRDMPKYEVTIRANFEMTVEVEATSPELAMLYWDSDNDYQLQVSERAQDLSREDFDPVSVEEVDTNYATPE